jgi:polar amino acid transport system permease protein
MRSRRERFREWAADQTPVSWAAVAVGSAALIVGVAGTVVLWIARGITPWESIVASALSGTQTAILVAALVLGIAAMAVGFGTCRIMPTKHARETAISGGALGIQAALFAAALLLFRAGENFDLFVRQNMRFELLGDFWRQFVTGARNTVILAAAGEGFGIALGIALALLILSQRVVVRAPARAYINFFRGTPLVWQFSFFFFGIVLGMRLPLSVYQVAILVLSLNAGAYTAEIFRAGIQSIERGQVEAARSLGMSYLQSMGYVVLPQAFRRVIPPLTNEFIILIKDTSLVFVLGLTAEGRELFSVGRDAYGERFNATLYIGTVLGYLAITLPMLRVVTDLERRLRSGLGGFMA